MPDPTKRPETALECLTRGLMPHIARRIVRAYWIGAAEGATLAARLPDNEKPEPRVAILTR